MINLWFWTFLVAASFAVAVYLQASEPGGKIALAGLGLIAGAGGLFLLLLPQGWREMGAAELSRLMWGGPDALKWDAMVTIGSIGLVVMLGGLVGIALRGHFTAGKLGGGAFVVGFLGLNVLAFAEIFPVARW